MSRNISFSRRLIATRPSFVHELNGGIHFGQGSQEPTWPKDDRLRLYSMRFCPYAARVHLILNIKRIPYNVAYCELKNKPEWLWQKSPRAKVPALELPNGELLVESLVIADYLDEQYPELPLHPKDPLQKAKDKLLVDKFAGVSRRMMLFAFGKSQNFEEDCQKVLKGLQDFNSELERRGTQFFYGSRPGMLDLLIWPWFSKFPLMSRLVNESFNLRNFPRLERWTLDMLDQEAVRGFLITPEQADTFFQGAASGQPNYNILAAKASL